RFHDLLAGVARRCLGGAGPAVAQRDRGDVDPIGCPDSETAPVNLLETTKLKKYFGETHAVDGVDFTVREGEGLALIGSNGAGKTSLVNLISGLFSADSGRILLRGQDVTTQSVHDRIKSGIARSFQIVNLFDQLTLLDNVALAIFSRQGITRRLWSLADHY